jgi:YD repeat-containing protein
MASPEPVASPEPDLANRRVSTTNALGFVSSTVFDPASRVIANVDPLGHAVSFAYDAASRRVSTTNALGFTNTAIFDAANRPIANVDPLGHTNSIVYDTANRRIATVNALGKGERGHC